MELSREMLHELGLDAKVVPVEGFDGRHDHEYVIKTNSGLSILIVFSVDNENGKHEVSHRRCFVETEDGRLHDLPGMSLITDLFAMCRIIGAVNVDISIFEQMVMRAGSDA